MSVEDVKIPSERYDTSSRTANAKSAIVCSEEVPIASLRVIEREAREFLIPAKSKDFCEE